MLIEAIFLCNLLLAFLNPESDSEDPVPWDMRNQIVAVILCCQVGWGKTEVWETDGCKKEEMPFINLLKNQTVTT